MTTFKAVRVNTTRLQSAVSVSRILTNHKPAAVVSSHRGEMLVSIGAFQRYLSFPSLLPMAEWYDAVASGTRSAICDSMEFGRSHSHSLSELLCVWPPPLRMTSDPILGADNNATDNCTPQTPGLTRTLTWDHVLGPTLLLLGSMPSI